MLVIAKVDRLSRDAHFLLGLEKAGVDFVAGDMPNANRLTARLMAVVAQEEREMISARTKAALAAAKARGTRLGGTGARRAVTRRRAERRVHFRAWRSRRGGKTGPKAAMAAPPSPSQHEASAGAEIRLTQIPCCCVSLQVLRQALRRAGVKSFKPDPF